MHAPLQYARASDGVRIAYLSVGEGPAIVFASNIFGDAHFYNRLPWINARWLTDELAAFGWRVIRHDVRGMGSSDRNVEDLGLDARLRDLEAVVGRLGLESCVLAGTDIGAATAIAFAARHPERVTKLVLLSPWASGTRMFALPALRVACAAMMSGEHQWTIFTNVLASLATVFGTGDLGRQVAAAMQESSTPHGLAEYYRTTEALDLSDLLPCVQAPTLVIHEGAFPFGSYELCKEVAAGILDSRLTVLQGPSLVGQAHDGYAPVIDSFLRGGKIASESSAHSAERRRGRDEAAAKLTAREIEVLGCVAGGLMNKEIAARLEISVPTVERHLANIYAKIGARGRTDATAYAVRLGLDTPLR